MWVCLNDSFLSIVEDFTSTSTPRELLVRSRISGHLEAVFPNTEVREDENSDYRFRSTIQRQVVADAIAKRVMSIDYTNFKDSVKSRPLHDAYMAFWTILHRLQERMR